MSITITKRGIAPSKIVYHGKCRSCATEVSYNKTDLAYDQREPGAWVVCPVCKGPIYHTNTPVTTTDSVSDEMKKSWGLT